MRDRRIIRRLVRHHVAELRFAAAALNDCEPFGDGLAQPGGVIEVIVARNQMRDRLSRRKCAGVSDHGLRNCHIDPELV